MKRLIASLLFLFLTLPLFAGIPYLDNTVRKVQVILAAAKTTSDLQWTASYTDYTATAVSLPMSNSGTTNGLTAVDVVPAPSASTSRRVITFSLYNGDTVATTATVRLSDNGTYYTEWYGTLNVGDQLSYCEAEGFFVSDNTGSRKTIQGIPTFSGLAFPGRLSLSSTVAVPTSNITAATAIYYIPAPNAVGYLIPIYNGSTFAGYSITSSGLTLTLNTSNHLSGKLYDIFAIYSSGSLVLVTGPAWTSSTARSQAITQATGNIWTNSTSMTAYNGSTSYSVAQYQGTCLGTFYASANGQTEIVFSTTTSATAADCLIWNLYNQVPVILNKQDSTSTWTDTNQSLHQLHGTYQCNVVCGMPTDITMLYFVYFQAIGAENNGIGLNSVSATTNGTPQSQGTGTTSGGCATASNAVALPIGFNYLALLVQNTTAFTATYSGAYSYQTVISSY